MSLADTNASGTEGQQLVYEAGEAGTYRVCDGDTEGVYATPLCCQGVVRSRVIDAFAGLAAVRQERATEVTLTVVHYALRQRQ